MSYKDKYIVGNKGLNLDSPLHRFPNDSWRFALNAVVKNRHGRQFGIGPEHSTEQVAELGNVVGSLYLGHLNSTLVFKGNEDITLFSHETKKETKVFNPSEFNCSFGLGKCEYHDITFQTITDTIIYFSSQNEYYSFNLDEMLNPKRKEGLKKSLSCEGCITGCDYFKIFLPSCGIKINAARQKGAGGSLASGTITFVGRYITRSGSWTNWGAFSNLVNISSPHNIPGETSRDSVLLKISGLDCKYNTLEIAVVEVIAGVPKAKILDRISYKGRKLSYVYSGKEVGTDISTEELMLTDHTNIRGRYLFNKDSVMYYYGIKPVPEYNVQKIANGVRTSTVEYQVPYSFVKKFDLKSLMGGETYALGLWLNRDDGTTTFAGTIPATPVASQISEGITDGVNEGVNDGAGGGASSGNLTIKLNKGRSVENTRSDTFQERSSSGCDGDPQSVIASWVTEVEALCEALKPGCENLTGNMFNEDGSINCDCGDAVDIYCQSEQQKRHAELCFQDIKKLDTLLNDIMDQLSDYGIDEVDVDFSPDTIKDSAERIIDAVKKRERLVRSETSFSTTYSKVTYPSAQAKSKRETIYGDNFHDANGDEDFDISYYKIAEYPTTPKVEKNQLYPCYTDCEGEFIYGELAGKPVTHHKVINRSTSPHFVSTSHGVKGKYNTEDPTEDLYVNLLSFKFDNIVIPSEEELGFKLCENNPYTIGIVPLTEANKTIQYKGVAFPTMKITNGGKSYDTPRHGAASIDEISRYHNGAGEHPRLANLGSGESHTLFSLDALVKNEPISATRIRSELMLSGLGERFGLYAAGKEPEDSIKGVRLDNRGARQHVYLSKSAPSTQSGPIDFIKDIPGNSVVAPPPGGKVPINNLDGQACTWVKSPALQKFTDQSFTSDVLNYNVPIPDAKGQYVAVENDIENQYGPVDTLTYKPVLWGKGSSVEGLVGDVYVGLVTFVKTSFVSDKVGSSANKFNIPAQVPIKKQRRCVCDSPEDILLEEAGMYVWTELPEEGNAADAKNWAGGHTIVNARTKPYNEAVGQKPISGYYYPKTQKTAITVPVESYVCPWLLEKGVTIQQQVLQDLDAPYTLDSGNSADNENAGWEQSYLTSQLYFEHKQPSTYRKLVKAFIRILIISILPAWGAAELFDVEGATDVVGTLIKSPMLYAMWYQLKNQLLTNANLDKLLGLPVCKTDDRGGETLGLRGFFNTYFQYNLDYSKVFNFKWIEGIPRDFTDCKKEKSNIIYISDQQSDWVSYDALKHVRPGNRIMIPTELGDLTNLFTTRGNFYAHTSDHIIPLQYNKAFVPTSLGDIQMGSGQILKSFEPIGSGIQEGFAGLRHKWLSKTTYLGELFVDIDSARIYLFDGQLNILSGNIDTFLKEHLEFCKDYTCKYERLKGIPHFDFAIDYDLDRVLITKVEGDKSAKDLKGSSWTLSWDIESKNFISFHSYTPDLYLYDRNTLFSLEDKVWQHGKLDSFRNIYGEFHPYIVELVKLNPPVTQKGGAITENAKTNNISVSVDASKYSGRNVVRDLDSFFNKVAYYNSTEGSGTKSIEVISDDRGAFDSMIDEFRPKKGYIRFFKTDREFFTDYIKDFTKVSCGNQSITTQDLCDYTYRIDESRFEPEIETKKGLIGETISDKYFVIRFIKDDEQDINLCLSDFNITNNEAAN